MPHVLSYTRLTLIPCRRAPCFAAVFRPLFHCKKCDAATSTNVLVHRRLPFLLRTSPISFAVLARLYPLPPPHRNRLARGSSAVACVTAHRPTTALAQPQSNCSPPYHARYVATLSLGASPFVASAVVSACACAVRHLRLRRAPPPHRRTRNRARRTKQRRRPQRDLLRTGALFHRDSAGLRATASPHVKGGRYHR